MVRAVLEQQYAAAFDRADSPAAEVILMIFLRTRSRIIIRLTDWLIKKAPLIFTRKNGSQTPSVNSIRGHWPRACG